MKHLKKVENISEVIKNDYLQIYYVNSLDKVCVNKEEQLKPYIEASYNFQEGDELDILEIGLPIKLDCITKIVVDGVEVPFDNLIVYEPTIDELGLSLPDTFHNVNSIKFYVDVDKFNTYFDYDRFDDYLSFPNVNAISLPDEINIIPSGFVRYVESLSSFTISHNIDKIGSGAFSYSNLSSVSYNGETYTSESALETVLTNNNVLIGDIAFYGTNLTD